MKRAMIRLNFFVAIFLPYKSICRGGLGTAPAN